MEYLKLQLVHMGPNTAFPLEEVTYKPGYLAEALEKFNELQELLPNEGTLTPGRYNLSLWRYRQEGPHGLFHGGNVEKTFDFTREDSAT